MEENKQSKTDELLAQLEEGVSAIFSGDHYKQYLDTMSRFHNYSLNNCILIAMQKPDATYVAGYNAWNEKFNRQVLKGERGIKIIAPVTHIKEKPVFMDGKPQFDSDGQLVTEKIKTHGFKASTVFDISQTEGEPLPSFVSDLVDPVQGFDDYMDAIKEISPVPIRFDNIDSGAKGFYSYRKQEIVIQRGMPEEQTIKTMIHECAHARLGHGSKDNQYDRRTREVQAESVAYCTCKAIGIDASDYSFGYIAGWSAGKELKELKSSLQVIREQTNQMIQGIEAYMKQRMEVRAEIIKEDISNSEKRSWHIAM